MRWIEGNPKFYTYAKWRNLLKEGPVLMGYRSTSPRCVLELLDDHIDIKEAYRNARYTKSGFLSYSPIKIGSLVISLYPKYWELETPVVGGRQFRAVIQFTKFYNITFRWLDFGPNKGHWNICSDGDIITPPQYYLYEDIRTLRGVVWEKGKQFNYLGSPINDKPPSMTECRKLAETHYRRSSAGRRTNKEAQRLGFKNIFLLNGYPMPKSYSKISDLNRQAKEAGYYNVAEAWKAGVTIVDNEYFEGFEDLGLVRLFLDGRRKQ